MFFRKSSMLSESEISSEETQPTNGSTEPPSSPLNSSENKQEPDEVQGSKENPEKSKITLLETELAALQAKFAETHDRMMRIAADGENTRKRLEKEKKDVRLYSIQEFAKDLLPVMDAVEKAMSTFENFEVNPETEEGKKVASVVEGVELVAKVFQDTVKKHGIERLPGVGTPFNPLYHNAITKVVDPTLTQETVVDEFIPGYKIGDRILRTAMVRVGSPD